MIPVVTAAEARELDRRTIVERGVPGVSLMELASKGVADVIRDHEALAAARGVVVVCGGGNNGGDGWGVARWLQLRGLPVSVWPVGGPLSGDAATMEAAARRFGVPIAEEHHQAGLIVDALFGTGLNRDVVGDQAAAIARINAHPARKVAVDLPSGLDADTGRIHGVAVQADRTVTFGHLKRGLVAGSGPDLAGVVHRVEIGVEGTPGAPFGAGLVEARDLAWPRRSVSGHKTRSGHLGILAGSEAMAGAAVLCARGALAAGAGLVTLLAPRGALGRLGGLPPEVMVRVCGEGPTVDAGALGDLGRFDALVAGPGLGGGAPLSPELGRWLARTWTTAAMGLLYDADALPFAVGAGPGPRVITPHAGEAARRLQIAAPDVDADRFGAAARLAVSGRVAILKGRFTLIASGAGPIRVNPTGNPVLSTGGTGDVLSGLVGALLARGLSGEEAAVHGVYVHGLAADRLRERRIEGWTAGDVAAEVPAAVQQLLG